MFVFLNAFVFNTPEIFIGTAQNKFNDKGELTDDATRGFLGKQLEGFAKFVERVKA
jgi:chromate reductase